MKTPFAKSKRGFTIIEVSLVLAIGGLIMLMVFIAWPAVQRNQRDTQRRTVDLNRLYTQLTNYSVNNKGNLPSSYMVSGVAQTATISGDDLTGTDRWTNFYKNYLIAGGTEEFEDPQLGVPYSLIISPCSATGYPGTNPNNGLSIDGNCTGTSTTPAGALYASKSLLTATGVIDPATTFQEQSGYINIVIGAKCADGEQVVAATNGTGGARKFAIMYKLESGIYCLNN